MPATETHPLLDFPVGPSPQDPDGPAIAALLQCRSALATPSASAKANLDFIDAIFKERIQNIDPVRAIQDYAHITNKHLADLEHARSRVSASEPGELETAFLSIQTHPSNDDFHAYLETYSVNLWNTLMPNQLPSTLIHAILAPALNSMIELASTPWIIHLLIATAPNMPFLRLSSQDSLATTVRKYVCMKRTNSHKDRNPFVRDLLYKFGSRSLVFRILRKVLQPLDGCIAVITNRLLQNLIERSFQDQGLGNALQLDDAMAYVRDRLLLESHRDPNFVEKARFKKMAFKQLPKVFGTSILPHDVFDSYLINRRLVIAYMDQTLKLLRG